MILILDTFLNIWMAFQAECLKSLCHPRMRASEKRQHWALCPSPTVAVPSRALMLCDPRALSDTLSLSTHFYSSAPAFTSPFPPANFTVVSFNLTVVLARHREPESEQKALCLPKWTRSSVFVHNPLLSPQHHTGCLVASRASQLLSDHLQEYPGRLECRQSSSFLLCRKGCVLLSLVYRRSQALCQHPRRWDSSSAQERANSLACIWAVWLVSSQSSCHQLFVTHTHGDRALKGKRTAIARLQEKQAWLKGSPLSLSLAWLPLPSWGWLSFREGWAEDSPCPSCHSCWQSSRWPQWCHAEEGQAWDVPTLCDVPPHAHVYCS